MADRVNEQNYESMISALQQYASKIDTEVDNMQSLGNTCVQAIGEEDNAVSQIVSKLKACEKKYLEAAKQALDIAKSMQEELDAQKKEDELWNSDD